jgi:hypothetical protein
MLEVPFLDEIVGEKTRATACETAQRYIVAFLEARFGDLPGDLVEEIESIDDEKQLRGLVRSAGSCPDLEAFRKAMTRR